jgi:hypothetical protein
MITRDSVSAPQRRFDWLAFLVRLIVITALATWLLIERMHDHDRTGVTLVVVIGYVILPSLAYLHTHATTTPDSCLG